MELLTVLAADYANVAQGAKINVMGIFRTIYATNFPTRHPSMFLVVKFGADIGEFGDDRILVIKLRSPDGQEIMRYEQPMKIPLPQGGQRPEMNFLLQINDIVFPSPGRYQFSIHVDKDFKGDLALDVVQLVMQQKEEKQEK